MRSSGMGGAGIGGVGRDGRDGRRPTGTAGGTASTASSTELVDLLNGTSTRWSAATIGSQSTSSYILGTNTAVMAIGGWGGGDNSPTLADFQAYVANGDISYLLMSDSKASGNGGGGMDGQGGDSTSSASAITSWVEGNYLASTVGGVTVYNLTAS